MMFLRRLLDLPLLVILMGIGSASMVMPAAYAVVLGQFDIARAFFYAGSVLLILTAIIALATAPNRPGNAPQGQLASVIGAYIVLPFLLAVPVHQAMPGLAFRDAWFEMLSCFTATGATIFETPGTVAAPIHFWRAFVGWSGGFYCLLIAASVLAPLGLGGVELLGGRAPGRAGGNLQITSIAKPAERIVHFAKLLFPVYTGLTLVLWVALLLCGDTAFIALCHAMGTLSTSGISPLVGLADTESGARGEVVIFAVLGLAVSKRLWQGGMTAESRVAIWRDPELRLAIAIVAVVTLVLALRSVVITSGAVASGVEVSAGRAIWAAAFTALSFLTTTGYQSAFWPDLGAPGLFLLGLAIVGGGVATTAGGVKLLRVYALLRHGERELERIVHPHSIGGHGQVARRLRREGAYLAWVFFMIFGLSLAAITAALTLTGMGFQQAFVLGIACLSTTGQLASAVGDTQISYSGLGATTMGILGAAMVLGRLEILAVLALFAPKAWSR